MIAQQFACSPRLARMESETDGIIKKKMISIPVRITPKCTNITLKQSLGLWMMLGYQQQPSHCLPVPSQRMPGTSCCKLSTQRKRGGNNWKCFQLTNVLNLSVCMRAHVRRTNCMCRWTDSKCSGLTETDAGYTTAWLLSHYIVWASSPFFISPPTHCPLCSCFCLLANRAHADLTLLENSCFYSGKQVE